ncbi:MAG: S-layer homology domain-containing protein [Syntrophomonadaceae bacterium]
MNRLEGKKTGVLLAVLLLLFSLSVMSSPANAATTRLTITKLANDGSTVIAKKTVDYEWMMDNLPVIGDGNTHYYHQGPVFIDDPDEETQEELRWNPEEDTNIEKDMGAVMGTNLTDLCDLVGGMSNGDTIKIKASDGFIKEFAYDNVYEYSGREGPMVVCWYKDGDYPDSGYSDGMRLVWFADDNVFGNWDWHEAADEEYWYYYRSGGEEYPTTTGLSVQNISQLIIYSSEEPPEAPEADFAANKRSGVAPLTVKFSDKSANSPTSWEWDFDDDGSIDSDEQDPEYQYSEPGVYTVTLTVSNSMGEDTKVRTNYITVKEQPDTEVLFNGKVNLTPGETFTLTAYDSGREYTIDQDTALGALQAASLAGDFDYEMTDKNYSQSGTLLLDNIESYERGKPGYWYVYVNNVYKDSYNKKSQALNLIKVADGDDVDLYYADDIDDPADHEAVEVAALAEIRITVDITPVTKPVAAFQANPLTGNASLAVSFINQSTGSGTLKYGWDFDNDGTVDSTTFNPTHFYDLPGVYTVKLTVTNSAGSDDETKPAYILVNPAQPVNFTDITGHWAQANIEKLVARGTVSGYPDASFRPNATITRAEFATMLVKAFRFDARPGKTFADTANHWARENIATATALGILSGYNALSFGPDDPITREQMAVMITKAAGVKQPSPGTAFTDNNLISAWAGDAVAQAVNSRIMSGYPDNTFRPQGKATRAEAVTVLINALRI